MPLWKKIRKLFVCSVKLRSIVRSLPAVTHEICTVYIQIHTNALDGQCELLTKLLLPCHYSRRGPGRQSYVSSLKQKHFSAPDVHHNHQERTEIWHRHLQSKLAQTKQKLRMQNRVIAGCYPATSHWLSQGFWFEIVELCRNAEIAEIQKYVVTNILCRLARDHDEFCVCETEDPRLRKVNDELLNPPLVSSYIIHTAYSIPRHTKMLISHVLWIPELRKRNPLNLLLISFSYAPHSTHVVIYLVLYLSLLSCILTHESSKRKLSNGSTLSSHFLFTVPAAFSVSFSRCMQFYLRCIYVLAFLLLVQIFLPPLLFPSLCTQWISSIIANMKPFLHWTTTLKDYCTIKWLFTVRLLTIKLNRWGIKDSWGRIIISEFKKISTHFGVSFSISRKW